MIWTQVASNVLIGLAYLSISITLVRLVSVVKLPFSWIYIAFGIFILACGMTHFLDVVTVWHPIYWVDAVVRMVTAAASVGTALLIVPFVPKVVGLSKISDLVRERGQQLEGLVQELSRTVAETKRYRQLVESTRDALFILDRTGIVATWNTGAEEIKGYRDVEIIGKHFSTFYLPEDIAAKKPEHELEVTAREGFFEDEGWRLRKDGSRFWASVKLTAMRDESGNTIGFAKLTRDLSERVATEERLRRLAADNARLAEQTRIHEFQERFLAILGHDLRNPLAAIDMGAELLRQRSANDADTGRILARIRSSSLRMSRMIEQILDLTRSRLGGGLEMNPAPMNLCAVITQVVDELRTAYPARTIHLRCSSLNGTWDRDRLEQMFSNIIGNAVHHGLVDHPVTVDAHLQEKMVSIEVHNAGPPIAPELLRQLFNPFRRGTRDSRDPKTAGLGLGLYISREIAHAHGGEVEVRSAEGAGTTFRIMLPRPAHDSVQQ